MKRFDSFDMFQPILVVWLSVGAALPLQAQTDLIGVFDHQEVRIEWAGFRCNTAVTEPVKIINQNDATVDLQDSTDKVCLGGNFAASFKGTLTLEMPAATPPGKIESI